VANNDDTTAEARSHNLSGRTVGQYRIAELIGKGGMGEVYRAEDTLLKLPVAIKRISPDLRNDPVYRRLFLTEAKRAQPLNDKRIARINHAFEESGELFLVMEYVEGGSLRTWLKSRCSLDDFMDIALQCAAGLLAAHESDVIHGDIKPENIMLTSNREVKICDFGLARRGASSATTAPQTHEFGFRGTCAYSAPEVLRRREVSKASDIFSLGIVFYELLTGVHPFKQETAEGTVAQIISAEMPSLSAKRPDIPDTIAEIIAKMLRKEPIQRYSSLNEVVVALEEAARLLRPVRKSVVSGRENKWRLPVVAVVVVLLVTSSALLFLPSGNRNPSSPNHVLWSIVVLPFVADDASDKTISVYSMGLAETLTARLARINKSSNVHIAPSTEVVSREVRSIEDARKAFGANLIVSGNIRRAGNSFRVVFSLSGSDLNVIAGDAFTTDYTDAFAAEDLVAEKIIGIIRSEIEAQTASDLSNSRPVSPRAYDYYVQGLGYLLQHDSATSSIAVELLTKAALTDPRSASAQAALGQAYVLEWQFAKGSDPNRNTQVPEKARASCESAIQLDPRQTAGAICLGGYYSSIGLHMEAIRQFDSALESDPANDAAYRALGRAYEELAEVERRKSTASAIADEYIHQAEQTYLRAINLGSGYFLNYDRLGEFYYRQGRNAESINAFKKEISLTPDNAKAYRSLAAVYIRSKEDEAAIATLEKSLALRPSTDAYINLGAISFRKRDYARASAEFEQARKIASRPDLQHTVVGALARAKHWSGNRAEAKAYFEEALTLAKGQLARSSRKGDVHILLALYNAMLGQRGAALEELKFVIPSTQGHFWILAAAVHAQLGNDDEARHCLQEAKLRPDYSATEIQTTPELDVLRSKPGFGTFFVSN